MYLKEYTGRDFVSIPVVKLPNYSAVPVHCTEEDVREIIEHEENEILEAKLKELTAKEPDIYTLLKDWDSHRSIDRAAQALNGLLFPLIFTGQDEIYNCACPDCQNKMCYVKKGRQCNINKGFKKKSEKVKLGFQHTWNDVLQPLNPGSPDLNLSVINQFIKEEITKGAHIKLQDDFQGVLANMRGRNSENYLASTFELHFGRRRGLLLNGFKMRENLKLFFDAYNIELQKTLVKGKLQERKDVEHDVLHLTPSKDEVLVTFVQAKSQLNVPWTQAKRVENARRVIEKACSQGVADVDTFSHLASYFLTDDQQKIQELEEDGRLNTIEGIQRNVKEKGICFEKTVFKERLQIPMEFIKKFGFLDIRKEESKVFLDIVHLSYMEFCCAGSLWESTSRSSFLGSKTQTDM